MGCSCGCIRYLVFACDRYYPGGGNQDLVGRYATLAEAQECVKQHTRPIERHPCDSVWIYDVETGAEV